MYLSSNWPPYPGAIFFQPFPLSNSVFFRQSYITLPPYPPGVERKTSTVPSLHLTPLIFYLSAIILYLMGRTGWEGGSDRGGEKIGGGSRKRDKKYVKIWMGGKKRKFCACRSEGRREPPPPSTLSYLKTKATIHLVLNSPSPPPTHTHTFWFEAVCNHFEKCVDQPTVIIIKKRKKKLENILCEESSKVRQFFLLT